MFLVVGRQPNTKIQVYCTNQICSAALIFSLTIYFVEYGGADVANIFFLHH